MQLIVRPFCGQTVVINCEDPCQITGFSILEALSAQIGVPAHCLVLKGEGGCRLAEDHAFLPEQTGEQVWLQADLKGGLRGGKGGFGAMLRALAKQNTGHKTTDFGACRDLNGRRLRHVNNDLKLKKWQEARERKERAKEAARKAGKEAVSDDEDEAFDKETPSGIRGWYLGVPGWIDHVKKRETKEMRRKAAGKRKWEDEERDIEQAGLATRTVTGTVTMVDKVRHAFCVVDGDIYVPFTANVNSHEDWSAGLLVGDRLLVTAVLKPQGKNKWYAYRAEKVKKTAKATDSLSDAQAERETSESAMSDLVTEGLRKAAALKKKKKEAKLAERSKMMPVDLEGKMRGMRWGEAGWLGLLAGEIECLPGGTVRGVSEFGSVCAVGVSLREGKWYYEVELRTAGVMQVGWADHLFKGDSENGDGVGDDQHSWAYDGCRQMKWNKESEDYGTAWKEGDVVGCLLDLDAGTVSFTLNGEHMDSAFTGIALAQAGGTAIDPGFFPASSLEDGEVLRLRVSEASLAYGPPKGYKPVADAMAVPPSDVLPAQPVLSDAESLEPVPVPHTDEATVQAEAAKPEAAAAANVERTKPSNVASESQGGSTKKAPHAGKGGAAKPVQPKALDLKKYKSAEELEALGLDRLKAALMFLGMKCGGTLSERASRLYSVKGVPKDKIDPSLRAGGKKGKRKRQD